MAKKNERDMFSKNILSAVGSNTDKLSNTEITGFLSVEGNRYDHELMVVGRAVNGGDEGIFTSELDSPVSREEYAEVVYKNAIGSDGCPMQWVIEQWGDPNNYNTKRSAFWRVIRDVVGELGIADIEHGAWSSHLVWSNLYKVAPVDGGNPNTTLCDIQLSGCRSLFELELSNYNPKRLLLLTGLDWAEEFLTEFSSIIQTTKSHVKATGRLERDDQMTRVVVATHPQGKPEKEWGREVIDEFQA